MGLLKKGLSAFHQRCGWNGAGASDAIAGVADCRFRVRLRPSSKVGFFNSPTVTLSREAPGTQVSLQLTADSLRPPTG